MWVKTELKTNSKVSGYKVEDPLLLLGRGTPFRSSEITEYDKTRKPDELSLLLRKSIIIPKCGHSRVKDAKLSRIE